MKAMILAAIIAAFSLGFCSSAEAQLAVSYNPSGGSSNSVNLTNMAGDPSAPMPFPASILASGVANNTAFNFTIFVYCYELEPVFTATLIAEVGVAAGQVIPANPPVGLACPGNGQIAVFVQQTGPGPVGPTTMVLF